MIKIEVIGMFVFNFCQLLIYNKAYLHKDFICFIYIRMHLINIHNIPTLNSNYIKAGRLEHFHI